MIADLPARLDRIAQQADQVLALQDPGRRLETIEAALRVLSDVQTDLLDQSGLLAGALTTTTTNWANLLIAERDVTRIALESARELDNPFIFGNPVQELGVGLFTGRRDIVLEIERTILCATQTPTLLLYGQRRMGKTSILIQLPSLLGPNFLPVIFDCQAPTVAESQAALLRHLSRCMSSALNSCLGIAYDDEGTRRSRGAVPLPLDDLRDDAFSVFEDWLDRFQSRLPHDMRVLICLDEFERLKETVTAGWGTRFLDALRHWLQHRPNFALMFVGSHTFEQLGPVWTDRFISARRLKVSFLGADDVRQLLTRPTPTFRLAYAAGALEAIFASTHGQPFLTQALASELVHHMNRLQSKEANTTDVENAIDQVLECAAEYFADLWFTRTEDERVLLRELAKGNRPPSVGPATRDLCDYDVLDNRGEFAVPLVRLWVERNQLQC